jgi:hypothetical protein
MSLIRAASLCATSTKAAASADTARSLRALAVGSHRRAAGTDLYIQSETEGAENIQLAVGGSRWLSQYEVHGAISLQPSPRAKSKLVKSEYVAGGFKPSVTWSTCSAGLVIV